MSRFFIADIGAGTMDILYYDTKSGTHYKTVARSPVLTLAEQVAKAHGNILITGCEMGGGSLSQILKERAQKADVVMSVSAAATIHHDQEKVKSLGIRIVGDDEAEQLRQHDAYHCVSIGDLEPERLEQIVRAMGVPFSFDVVGLCVQDHGVPPRGMSHLDYRHHIFKASFDARPFPHAVLYRGDEIPETLNRLTCIGKEAAKLPAAEVYVMDSGMAAILGASMDPLARHKRKIMVLDVATSHTVGAAIEDGEIAGFFEYHTRDITLERLEDLLEKLPEGNLEHSQILKEGGHGAYIRKALGFGAIEMIVATGPKRRLVRNSRLSITLGAPLGDNMMTGTVGVLEAICRRKGLEPMDYV
jgi:uncharacterized protein (DUF1786 family)